MQGYGYVDRQRRQHIERRGTEKIRVHQPPRAFGPQPQRRQSSDNDHVLDVRHQIVVEVVLPFRRQRVHPREDDEDVQEGPPGEQRHEIEIAEAKLQLALPAVRLQSECRHDRYAAEEENNVAAIDDRNRLVRVDLVVRPIKLAQHPQSATQRQKHPKDVAPPMGSARVQQQKGVGYQRHHALHQVSKAR